MVHQPSARAITLRFSDRCNRFETALMYRIVHRQNPSLSSKQNGVHYIWRFRETIFPLQKNALPIFRSNDLLQNLIDS